MDKRIKELPIDLQKKIFYYIKGPIESGDLREKAYTVTMGFGRRRRIDETMFCRSCPIQFFDFWNKDRPCEFTNYLRL